jgi:hypothetical protein
VTRKKHTKRGEKDYWLKLGLDDAAALLAKLCFPEGWAVSEPLLEDLKEQLLPWLSPADEGNLFSYYNDKQKRDEAGYSGNDARARYIAQEIALNYHLLPTHPAFWHMQGCDFDEMAEKAVSILTMDKKPRKGKS